MKELRSVLEGLGLEDVSTYIQSGNVVFRSKRAASSTLGKKIGAAIRESHGFVPAVHLLTADQLDAAIEANPFPEAVGDPKTLHLFFLDGPARSADLETLEALRGPRERFVLTDTVFYLHAPDGVARSRLAARAEKALGVTVTARNWRTVGKVMELASA
jgi:uncharacterized protein (DUF1697 family)